MKKAKIDFDALIVGNSSSKRGRKLINPLALIRAEIIGAKISLTATVILIEVWSNLGCGKIN